MKRDLTKNLQLAQNFLNVFFNTGRESFVLGLEEYARMVVRTYPADDYQVNLRFLTIVSGVLLILHGDQPETLFRRQVLVAERFLSTPDLAKKITCFREDLVRYLEAYQEEKQANTLSDRILLYLKTCPQDELRQANVESLSDRFRYHRNYLSRKFREEKNCTVHDAIMQEKLNRTSLLLKQAGGKLTTRELAEMFGFSDAGHFSRQFEKRYGVKPSAFGAMEK